MANKDDRYINVTLKNEDDEKGEVIISFSGIWKQLKKYFVIWIVAAVVILALTLGMSAFSTLKNKPRLTALISFTYPGIEKGLDPAGQEFDVYSIKNPVVIEDALTQLGYSLEDLEDIRQGITIEGIIPHDAADKLAVYQSIYLGDSNAILSAAQEMLEVSYNPSQYKVYFDYDNTGYSSSQAVQVFNKVLECYRDYFFNAYGYNKALGSAVTAVNYEDYDYTEALDVFDSSLSNMKNYVRELSNDDTTHFRSVETGFTFDDLYQALKTVESIDLDKISSYITVNNLTKDKEESIAYYEYRISSLTRTKAELEENLSSVLASIEAYEKDTVLILGNGTDSTDAQISQGSQKYDNLFTQKENIQPDLSETKQRINFYNEKLVSLKNNPIGSDEKCEKVEEDFIKLNEKINELIKNVELTATEYYETVAFANAYNILVPATSSASKSIFNVIDNAKLHIVIFEALAFIVYFGAAFVLSIIAESKKKAKALETDNGNNDDDNDNDDNSDDDKSEDRNESKKTEKSEKSKK